MPKLYERKMTMKKKQNKQKCVKTRILSKTKVRNQRTNCATRKHSAVIK